MSTQTVKQTHSPKAASGAGKFNFWKRRRRITPVLQMETTECGAACLTMILNYYNYRTTISQVREKCGVGRDGLTALTLVQTARNYGLRVKALSIPHTDLSFVPLPAIVHWDFTHFLVVEGWSAKFVDVVDPGSGRRRIPMSEFEKSFTGIVVTLEPGIQTQLSDKTNSTGSLLKMYLRYLTNTPGIIVQVIAVSLILQLLGLVMPVLTQIMVDQVIPLKLTDTLAIIALGMLLIVISQMVISFLRATLLVYLQTRVDAQVSVGFLEHLLALPYRFFQQRSTGDLMARLNSNALIRDILTNQLIATLLDGSFVIIYLFILLSQSFLFGLVALVIGVIQLGLMSATNRIIANLMQQELAVQAKTQAYLTESLVGIASIKAAGAETHTLNHWSNLFFNQLNIAVRRNYLLSLVETFMNGLRMLAPLLLLLVGTLEVLNGQLSVGTMLAFNTLAIAFLSPLASLINTGRSIQMVRAHLERIGDVISAEPEQNIQLVQTPGTLSGAIRLENVSFRYDQNAPLVLQNINLNIQAGQKIALVGRTGSGKSTLGKLLLGLYLPGEGQIFYDETPLAKLNFQQVRSQFGVVMQDAPVFSGSIRHNIAFNRPALEFSQVQAAAQAAAIHKDILQMPMGYDTEISEGGSAISGGQRQRLALARALAHSPAVLLLDEATSHLDVLTEQTIEQNLTTLGCTCISIAHRLSTIRNADLILVLEHGCIVEQGTHEQLLAKNGYYTQLVQTQLSANN